MNANVNNAFDSFDYMKKYLFALAALGLLFACTPENNGNNGGGQNNQEELTVTGEVSEITENSATLTGRTNLPIAVGDAEVGIVYDEERYFKEGKKMVATEAGENNQFTVTITGLNFSTTYYYRFFVRKGAAVKYDDEKSFTTKEPPCPEGAVDFGIVLTRSDGTKYKLFWAKTNLCESGLCAKPEDYGDYYAWGETATKLSYYWTSYKWGTGETALTKYNTNSSNGVPDNKTILDSGPEGDDVAAKKLSGKWRMPTEAEWDALCMYCALTWTPNYNGTGVAGRIVTRKIGGNQDNSIFLPAAGYRLGTELRSRGTLGFYWSSSLDTDVTPKARSIDFNLESICQEGNYRYNGYSVRPVSE